MARIVNSVLLLLLTLPALGVDDKIKEEPAPAAERYKELVKGHAKAMQVFFDYRAASTDEEKRKLLKEKYPDFGPQFLELAQKNPKDPVALDALLWVATNNLTPTRDKQHSLTKALDLLLRDHVQSEKLASVCQRLTFAGPETSAKGFLLGVLEKNPHKDVQAEACLALAQQSLRRADLIKELRKNADALKQYTEVFGEDYVEGLQKDDASKLKAESEKYFRQFTDEYLSGLSLQRLSRLCGSMAYSSDKGSEGVLRTLLENDARAEVQGKACVFLAKILSNRATAMPEGQVREAAILFKESEELFERAAAKYASVRLESYGSVGKKAQSELYALRHLSIGNAAPDIEAEDQDGKKFKLSDYRGKVVLLDFWSEN